jgi:hypothetical protein
MTPGLLVSVAPTERSKHPDSSRFSPARKGRSFMAGLLRLRGGNGLPRECRSLKRGG